MRIYVRVMFLASGVLVALASLGCGSGSTTPPPVGAVASTGNPLVAQYSLSHFDSGLSAWVEFGTDTTYGRQTSVMTSSSTGLAIQNLSILVAGMKPKTTYHMRAHATWPAVRGSIKTKPSRQEPYQLHISRRNSPSPRLLPRVRQHQAWNCSAL